MKIVTCIYDKSDGPPLYGRGGRGKWYRESLRCLAGMGKSIVLYVNPIDVVFFEEYYKVYKNILIKPFDIEVEYDKHPLINSIRQLHTTDRPDFYYEIAYCKMVFLRKEILLDSSEENFFWMDAGLSNFLTIPFKYFVESPKNHLEYTDIEDVSYNAYKMFTPGFADGLDKLARSKLFFIGCSNPHNPPIPQLYTKNIYSDSSNVIGGIFGGDSRLLTVFIDKFEMKVAELLEQNLLYTEESIMQSVVTDLPMQDDILIPKFDTWHHSQTFDAWGADYGNPELDQKPYYKILAEIPGYASV